MKHSDFDLQLRKLCEQERKELFEAIELHKGCYEWEEYNNRPKIAVFKGDNFTPEVEFVEVKKVVIENNSLLIFATDYYGGSYDIDPSHVLVGFLSRVIDALPEPG